jgi:hypothetical protein
MSKEYIKIDEHTIEERDTKVVSAKFDLKQLKARKQFIKAELDKVQALIDQAIALGVTEKPDAI